MKVLFANSMKGMGGGERWLLDCAFGLAQRGHEVCIAGRSDAPLLAAAAGRGLAVLAAPFRHDCDPASIGALRRAYQSFQPTVVVAQIQRAHRLAVLASALGPPVPVVVRVGQRRAPRRKLINRWMWGRLSMVLANCEAIRQDWMAERVLPPSRIRVLWSGLPDAPPADRTVARARLGIRPGTSLVVCVARLVHHKDHAGLLRAWDRVRSVLPEARLLLAGDGPESAALRRLAQKLGISSTVHFLGEAEAMSEVWAAADLAVLASRQEGAPYAILEALQAGVPCVATRIAGIPELLDGGRAGMLVPEGEPGALASAMLQVLNNPELHGRLRTAGRNRFKSFHRIGDMLNQAELLLSEAADGH